MKKIGLKNSRAFTLIELLIVVAIIGILATIIVVATADARDKGKDAAIKSNLDTIRKESAIYFLENNNSYWPQEDPSPNILHRNCDFYTQDPPGTGVNNGNMFIWNETLNAALEDAVTKGLGTSSGRSYCGNSATSWAVAVRLNSSGSGAANSKTWCVDSSGVAGLFQGEANNNPAQVLCEYPADSGNFFCRESYPCP